MLMKKYAIIVGGGAGSRMGHSTPKQFLELGGKPILMHTMEAFARSPSQPKIILVLKKDSEPYWLELIAHYGFSVEHQLVEGGESRFHSVKNALETIKAQEQDLENVLVSIHDGVRPFVSDVLIEETYKAAMEFGAVVTATTSRDSLREMVERGGINRAVDRTKFYLVQTPQTFLGQVIFRAYDLDYSPAFTDDASVVECFGHPIHIVNGDTQNIKITFIEDLAISEAILSLKISKLSES